MNTKSSFIKFCKFNGIPIKSAERVINGKYRPYLSALDNSYYGADDLYSAKLHAIQKYVKGWGFHKTIEKLSSL